MKNKLPMSPAKLIQLAYDAEYAAGMKLGGAAAFHELARVNRKYGFYERASLMAEWAYQYETQGAEAINRGACCGMFWGMPLNEQTVLHGPRGNDARKLEYQHSDGC